MPSHSIRSAEEHRRVVAVLACIIALAEASKEGLTFTAAPKADPAWVFARKFSGLVFGPEDRWLEWTAARGIAPETAAGVREQIHAALRSVPDTQRGSHFHVAIVTKGVGQQKLAIVREEPRHVEGSAINPTRPCTVTVPREKEPATD